MANQILFTPNDNNLGTVSNKVMVGKNFTGDLASFNGKVFTFNFDLLPSTVTLDGKTYTTMKIDDDDNWYVEMTCENLDWVPEGIILSPNTMNENDPVALYYNNENTPPKENYGLLYSKDCVPIINEHLNNLGDGWKVAEIWQYNTYTVPYTYPDSEIEKKYMSSTGWLNHPNGGGTDEFGFCIYPAGCAKWDTSTNQFNFGNLGYGATFRGYENGSIKCIDYYWDENENKWDLWAHYTETKDFGSIRLIRYIHK